MWHPADASGYRLQKQICFTELTEAADILSNEQTCKEKLPGDGAALATLAREHMRRCHLRGYVTGGPLSGEVGKSLYLRTEREPVQLSPGVKQESND